MSDWDDTVARRPARSEPIVELDPDLDETIQVPRHGVEVAAVPLEPLGRVQPAEPRVPERPRGEPHLGEIPGNVWSEPVPEKPAAFRLRLDDGTVVALDQPVYVGRKPSIPRIHPGGTPILISMSSPQREVSSTHLELTTSGGAIVASDMKSTNGSLLRLPNGEVRALVGGASAVVSPGTIIELGDGNTLELLSPEDPAPPSSRGETGAAG